MANVSKWEIGLTADWPSRSLCQFSSTPEANPLTSPLETKNTRFIVGESDSGTKGNKALESAMDILQAGLCETMIAGWLDSPPQAIAQTDTVQGSVFVALTTQQKQSSKHFIFKESRVLKNTTGREITSILDLF